jgi:CHAT domain-containing protein/Tfp pilus assembly protein PilF
MAVMFFMLAAPVLAQQPDEGARLAEEGWALADKGDYKAAVPLIERALAVREAAYGPEHELVAESLNDLASVYMDVARYKESEPLYLRALAMHERLHGPDDPRVAEVLNNLALLYKMMERPADVVARYERALAIFEKAYGAEHEKIANTLHNLASFYLDSGDYGRAEPLFLRALPMLERTLGADHARVATTLNSLATLYRLRAEYPRAEPLLVRAVAIAERRLGAESPGLAAPLNTLATLLISKGDFAAAEPLLARCLQIYEKALGAEHPNVATVLMNLAELDRLEGRAASAEPRLVRALSIREKALGAEHPAVAQALTNLAAVEQELGRDRGRIETELVRALAIREKAFGAEHFAVGNSLVNLGFFYRRGGDVARAEPAYARALAIRERSLGPDHPETALVHSNMAEMSLAAGAVARFVAAQSRASDSRERDAVRNLAAGSERQKVLYLDQTAREYWRTLSMLGAAGRGRPDAERLAFEMVLRRKGRALDAMARGVEALRERADPEDRRLLDDLADARSRLTALLLQGPRAPDTAAYRAEHDAARRAAERLESEVGARIVPFRAAVRHVALDDVLAKIPDGAALVEIAAYNAYDPKTMAFGERRYAALVAARSGVLKTVDLGGARAVDEAVAAMRAAVRDRDRDPRAAAHALEALVFEPLREAIGERSHVLVSPDGELNLVPFAALVDAEGRYLVERYAFTYLSSGRDLLRLDLRAEGGRPLVVADPDFGPVPPEEGGERSVRLEPGAEGGEAPASGLLDRLAFPRLPGTAVEARRVAGALPGAQVLTGSRATKRAVLEARGPEILHIATHGFFLDAEAGGAAGERTVRLLNAKSGQGSTATVAALEAELREPLLRSGLALAGANRPGGDGVLTALEAAGLDLWGTRLVVLSACNTGVGDVRSGDGVYGLRRALVLAGSESQMMSLWPVSDRATRDLMAAYYRALGRGAGRGDALRGVQTAMLAGRATRHPYYWAGFILSGAWGALGEAAGR